MERFTTVGMLSRVVVAICCLGLPRAALADDFSTDFEGLTDVTTAGAFTVTDGALSVRFEGGTVFSAGVGDLYRSGVKSWMVDPLGERGSNGTANAILSEGATRVTLYGRTQSGAVTARVRVLDVADVVIQETSLDSTTWTEINVTRVTGESPIKTIRVENMSGGTSDLMAAIDDFEFSTDAGGLSGGGGGNSSSLGPLTLVLLSLGGVMRRATRRRAVC